MERLGRELTSHGHLSGERKGFEDLVLKAPARSTFTIATHSDGSSSSKNTTSLPETTQICCINTQTNKLLTTPSLLCEVTIDCFVYFVYDE